jgi:hypothetical protein
VKDTKNVKRLLQPKHLERSRAMSHRGSRVNRRSPGLPRFARLLRVCLILCIATASAGTITIVPSLSIWPTARQASLAGVSVVATPPVEAGLSNPGALAFMRVFGLEVSYGPWLPGLWQGMNRASASVGFTPRELGIPAPALVWILNGVYQLSFTNMSLGELDVINEHGDFLGRYTPREYTLGSSYSFRFGDRVGAGLTLKRAVSDVAPGWAWAVMPEYGIAGDAGFAVVNLLDLGVLYRPSRRLEAGLSIVNVKWWSHVYPIYEAAERPTPTQLRLGCSLVPIDGFWSLRVPLEVDISMNPWALAAAGGAAELTVWEHFSARAGYRYEFSGGYGGLELSRANGARNMDWLVDWMRGNGEVVYRRGPCFGLGVHYWRLSVDLSSDHLVYRSIASRWYEANRLQWQATLSMDL